MNDSLRSTLEDNGEYVVLNVDDYKAPALLLCCIRKLDPDEYVDYTYPGRRVPSRIQRWQVLAYELKNIEDMLYTLKARQVRS